MRQITDRAVLQKYLNKYHIDNYFETPNMPYCIYEYEPGEMINILRPTEEYMKFIVDGTFDLYIVRQDGGRQLLHRCEAMTFVGELEFCGKASNTRYQEVVSKVISIEIPIKQLKEKLWNDRKFLRFLIEMLSYKLAATMPTGYEETTLRETLINYLKTSAQNHTIANIEELCRKLNYSRRQMHRTLNELLNDGKIERIGRGKYKLTE